MALSFTGSQFLTQSSNVGITAYPFSYSVWVNFTSLGANQIPIGQGITNTPGFACIVFHTSGSQVLADVENTSSGIGFATSAASVTSGIWYHAAAVFASPTSRTIYLNNVPTSNTTAITLPTTLNRLTIGALQNNGSNIDLFNGSIAYPTVWFGYALTVTDVSNLWNSGTGMDPRNIQPSNLASFSILQAGPPYLDSVTTANWTLTGSPSIVTDPFTLVPSIPTMTVQAATFISANSATLNGTIVTENNGGASMFQGFNYGPTTAYGSVASANVTLVVGSFSQNITGISAGTLYHYQSFAQNSVGTGLSSDSTFTTSVAIPNISSQAASSISSSTAVLNGTIISTGGSNETSFGFNYGLTMAYGSTVQSNGSFGIGPFSEPVIGLLPSTTYHFQAFASNSAGTSTTFDSTFTTTILLGAPTVVSGPVTLVTATSATLSASIIQDGGFISTLEGFNYGTTIAYGSQVSSNNSIDLGAFSNALVGLTPNSVYHYQAFAVNSFGTGISADATFMTGLLLGPPEVIVAPASSISNTSVVLNGAIVADGGSSSTTQGFNYGPTIALGSQVIVSSSLDTGPFSISISGLLPTTTYFFQAFATNNTATGFSNSVTFTTSATPITPPVTPPSPSNFPIDPEIAEIMLIVIGDTQANINADVASVAAGGPVPAILLNGADKSAEIPESMLMMYQQFYTQATSIPQRTGISYRDSLRNGGALPYDGQGAS